MLIFLPNPILADAYKHKKPDAYKKNSRCVILCLGAATPKMQKYGKNMVLLTPAY